MSIFEDKKFDGILIPMRNVCAQLGRVLVVPRQQKTRLHFPMMAILIDCFISVGKHLRVRGNFVGFRFKLHDGR